MIGTVWIELFINTMSWLQTYRHLQRARAGAAAVGSAGHQHWRPEGQHRVPQVQRHQPPDRLVSASKRTAHWTSVTRNVCIQVLASAEKLRSDGQSQVPAVCDRIQQGSTAGQLDSIMRTREHCQSAVLNGFICRDLAPWKAWMECRSSKSTETTDPRTGEWFHKVLSMNHLNIVQATRGSHVLQPVGLTSLRGEYSDAS